MATVVQYKQAYSMSSPISVTLDEAPQEGNLLVAISGRRSQSANIGAVPGWAQQNGGGGVLAVFFRIAESSETGTIQVSISGGSGGEAHLLLMEVEGEWDMDSLYAGTASTSLDLATPAFVISIWLAFSTGFSDVFLSPGFTKIDVPTEDLALAVGYSTRTTPGEVTPDIVSTPSPARQMLIAFALVPNGGDGGGPEPGDATLSATIHNADGTPASNAQVYAVPVSAYAGTSGANGQVTITGVAAGDYVVVARKGGNTTQAKVETAS